MSSHTLFYELEIVCVFIIIQHSKLIDLQTESSSVIVFLSSAGL